MPDTQSYGPYGVDVPTGTPSSGGPAETVFNNDKALSDALEELQTGGKFPIAEETYWQVLMPFGGSGPDVISGDGGFNFLFSIGNNSIANGAQGNFIFGFQNTVAAGAAASFVAGSSCTIGHELCVAMGDSVSVTAYGAAGIGHHMIITGSGASGLGGGHTLSYHGSFAAGSYALDQAHHQFSFGSPLTFGGGTALMQRTVNLLGTVTQNATQTEFLAYPVDGAASTMQLVPRDNTMFFVRFNITASRSTGLAQAVWVYEALVKRTSGTTAFVVSPTLIRSYGSNSGSPPAAWSVAIDIDSSTQALRIRGTGESSATIYWMASLEGMITRAN